MNDSKPKKLRMRIRRIGSDWCDEKVFLLIEQVQAQESLWNVSNDDYKNRSVRERAWHRVTEGVGGLESEIKAKWNGLRTAYRTALKTEMQTGIPMKMNCFYKVMGFIRPVLLFDLDCNMSTNNYDSSVSTANDNASESDSDVDYCQNNASHTNSDTNDTHPDGLKNDFSMPGSPPPPAKRHRESSDGRNRSDIKTQRFVESNIKSHNQQRSDSDNRSQQQRSDGNLKSQQQRHDSHSVKIATRSTMINAAYAQLQKTDKYDVVGELVTSTLHELSQTDDRIAREFRKYCLRGVLDFLDKASDAEDRAKGALFDRRMSCVSPPNNLLPANALADAIAKALQSTLSKQQQHSGTAGKR